MDDLDDLLARLAALIDGATGALRDNLSTAQIAEYRAVMEELLARYHLAAYMTGAGTVEVSARARGVVTEGIAVQLAFLDRFVTEIQDADEFMTGWEARARSYAGSIKVPYWEGRVKLLPLPAMPAQGTQCKNNCQCLWDITTIDAAAGDYDARWVRHADDSCQTCIQRAGEWNPLRIRGGVLQL